jgi:transcriptional regulator with XRE-family HTH domain
MRSSSRSNLGSEIGSHLKAVRQMHGLSQRELAKRSGVTNGLISLIEQDRVSPSVSSLRRILDSIPISLAEFFTLQVRPKPSVFYPREEQPQVGAGAVQARLVGSAFARRAMSLMHERFLPGADTGLISGTQGGEQGGIIVRGRIELSVEGELRSLGAGDAYYFESSMPHRFRNATREDCEIVSVRTEVASWPK